MTNLESTVSLWLLQPPRQDGGAPGDRASRQAGQGRGADNDHGWACTERRVEPPLVTGQTVEQQAERNMGARWGQVPYEKSECQTPPAVE